MHSFENYELDNIFKRKQKGEGGREKVDKTSSLVPNIEADRTRCEGNEIKFRTMQGMQKLVRVNEREVTKGVRNYCGVEGRYVFSETHAESW